MTTDNGHDLDELATIDVPVDEQRGDGLPRIWWKYGNQQAKIAGHFYIKADDWDSAPPAPWEECSLYNDEVGYKNEMCRLVPITKRSQPYQKIKKANGKDGRRYLDKWIDGLKDAQVHTEYLVFVEGLAGPVVWSFHGVTGKAVDGKGGIIPTASKAIAYEATKIYKKKIGLSAFWLPIGPEIDAKGKVFFDKLPEGSYINAPRLILPDLTGRDLLQSLYVGKDMIADVTICKDQYADWQRERRTNEPEPVVTQGGRNIPAEYDEDEEPPF
jgi:hypothetical protein